MPHTCSVKYCKTRGSAFGRTLHTFPKFPQERRDRWFIAVGRNPEPGLQSKIFGDAKPISDPDPTLPSIKISSRVCSLHFVTGRPSGNELHVDYVPSVNLKLSPTKGRRRRKVENNEGKSQKQDLMGVPAEVLIELVKETSFPSGGAVGDSETAHSIKEQHGGQGSSVSTATSRNRTRKSIDIGTQTDNYISRVVHSCVKETIDLKAKLMRLEAQNKELRAEMEAKILTVISTPGSVMKAYSLT